MVAISPLKTTQKSVFAVYRAIIDWVVDPRKRKLDIGPDVKQYTGYFDEEKTDSIYSPVGFKAVAAHHSF